MRMNKTCLLFGKDLSKRKEACYNGKKGVKAMNIIDLLDNETLHQRKSTGCHQHDD